MASSKWLPMPRGDSFLYWHKPQWWEIYSLKVTVVQEAWVLGITEGTFWSQIPLQTTELKKRALDSVMCLSKWSQINAIGLCEVKILTLREDTKLAQILWADTEIQFKFSDSRILVTFCYIMLIKLFVCVVLGSETQSLCTKLHSQTFCNILFSDRVPPSC